MEFFSHPIVAVVILLGVLIIVHETGHFLVGKACGIAVEIYSIGFGPTLLSFQHKETNYRLAAIPLGGYVKFAGSMRSEEVPPELRGREFYNASLLSRILTVAAGPLANFLLAIAVFSLLGFVGILQPPATVGHVMAGSPAEKAGLQFQDRIVEIDGREIASWRNLSRAIEASPGSALNVKVERAGELRQLSIVPAVVDDSELARQIGQIGISPLYVPSVLTISDLQGPFAEAGLETGMRVRQLKVNDRVYDVLYWQQLVGLLETYLAAGQRSFELEAYAVNPRGEKDSPEEQVATSAFQLEIPGERLAQYSGMEAVLGTMDAQLTIGEITEDISGLQLGDRLLAWNGKPLADAVSLSQLMSQNRESTANLSILRDGERQELTAQLKSYEVQRAEGKVILYTLPVRFWGPLEQPEPVLEQFRNPFAAAWYGVNETIFYSKTIIAAVVSLFTGDMPLQAIGGPIAIAKVASDSAKMGWQTFLLVMAWISINLGLVNLIPIPVLDGGQLVLLATEGAMRRPLSEVFIENYQKIGFVMVLALVVMATYNDIGRFWASMMRGMTSMF